MNVECTSTRTYDSDEIANAQSSPRSALQSLLQQETRKLMQPEHVHRSAAQKYKYFAEIAYDGTEYAGFQLQQQDMIDPVKENAPVAVQRKRKHEKKTIQGILEKTLLQFIGGNTHQDTECLTREALCLQGAGRTDAGVHAKGQCIHFYSSRLLDPVPKSIQALNAALPGSIAILTLRQIDIDFNVRFSCGKIYHYSVHTDDTPDPFLVRYRHFPWFPGKIRDNMQCMSEAAQLFVGTHDYAAFSNRSRTLNARAKTTIRTIHRFDIVLIDKGFRFEVHGNGFLYKQVRNMVGAVLAVGNGTMCPSDIQKLLLLGGPSLPSRQHTHGDGGGGDGGDDDTEDAESLDENIECIDDDDGPSTEENNSRMHTAEEEEAIALLKRLYKVADAHGLCLYKVIYDDKYIK